MEDPMARAFLLTLMSVIVFGGAAAAQELATPLAGFSPFIGIPWTGRVVSHPTPPGDHALAWAVTLNGHVVTASKTVTPVGFSLEILFYWDKELDCVAFVQLSSNGLHAKGTAEVVDGVITLEGLAGQAEGMRPFRQTFQILPDGTLEDRWYAGSAAGWIPQHVIVYRAAAGG